MPKKLGDFFIVQCNVCNLRYTNPFPNRTINYYPENYSSYIDPPKNCFKYRILNSIVNDRISEKVWIRILGITFKKQFLLPQGDASIRTKKIILDVGCSTGFILKFFKNLDWECHGIEIDKQAVNIAKNKGLKIFYGSFNLISLKENYYDIVRFNHVLEHLSHPFNAIKKSHQILKKGGLLLISVPNYDALSRGLFGKYWRRGFEIPRHLYHFKYNTLKKILEKNQFKIIRKNTASLPYLNFSSSFKFRFGLKKEPLFLKIIAIFFSLFQDLIGKGDAINIYARKY
ncbi:MAG: class I SAM-dependent methyltransferase [Patescibacteria group bacterium]